MALSLLEESLKVTKAKLGPDHPNTLISMNNLATGYRAAGKLSLALPLYKETLQLMKAKLGPDHPNTLTSMSNLAAGYLSAGKVSLALPLLEETLKLSKAKVGPDHPDTLSTMSNLAEGYGAAGKPDLALPLFQELLKLRQAKLGLDHPDTLNSMNGLASCYGAVGKLALALPLFEETLKMRKANLGPDHPQTLSSMNSLAVSYWRLKRLDRSVPLFEEALKLSKAKVGSDHPDTLRTLANLGVNYRDAARLPEAIPLLEEAYAKGRRHASLQWVGTALLDAYVLAGKKAEASTLIAERLKEARTKLPPESPQLAGVLAFDGLLLLKLQAHAEAEKLLRECLAIREKKEPDAWTTFNTQSMLGGALLLQKKYAEAEPLLLAGLEGMKQREAKIPPQVRDLRLQEAMGRLAGLFEATRKKEETRLKGELTDAKTQTVHEVKLTAGKAVVIDMHSRQFDTYLKLQDAQGKLLAENDDIDLAAKQLNSRLWFMPKADGVYRIIATSYQLEGRGDYEIIIREYSAAKSQHGK
jgi:tetratricopeptide (TPR) repeat protein